jgi:glycosyltransferase involved in cell wall biosynthesis
MKILHITQGYTPAIGGTELVIQRLSEELVQQYHDRLTVFTTNCYGADAFHAPWLPDMPVGQETINGVRIERFKVARWHSLAYHALSRGLRLMGLPVSEEVRVQAEGPIIPGFQEAISSQDCDLIAASSFPLHHMFDALEAARSAGRPCVLIGGIHPEDSWSFDRRMIYKAINTATHFVAYTAYEANHVISHGVDPKKVSVIGAGVDPPSFQKADGAKIRQRYGWGNEPVVGFIGQFSPHKGPDILLEAMNIVWRQIPEVRLLLAGARRKYATQLEDMANHLDRRFRERITFVYDFPEDMKPELFAGLDIFTYPSRFESFGIAFLEAWAAGKPVIGCRAGAIPDVVEHGKDGLLVTPGDAGGLAEAIISLINDPAKAHAMGACGKKKMMERYTWPEIARRFRAVYKQAVEKV